MSGQITSNVFRGSGVIAATAAGLNWVSTVVTASTLTAEAASGYWIDTTSNTCTITLPSSAAVGDQIVFIDYARTWGTNKIIIDSNGLNYQGEADTYTVEYDTDGETLNIVYADATKGWIPLNDDDVTQAPSAPPTQLAVFVFGYHGTTQGNIKNLVNSSGVVATDSTGVGTGKSAAGGVNYGGDKAISAYSTLGGSNLISNSGVVSTDVTTVGTAGGKPGATPYGNTGQAIFAFRGAPATNVSNLVTNVGVIGSDVTGVGTARFDLGSCGYATNLTKGIVYGGYTGAATVNTTNLISDTGIVASDVSSSGSARSDVRGASYGGDKGIMIMGYPNLSTSNLVSNIGVLSADVTGVGTGRTGSAAAEYGGDKALDAYGAVVGSQSSLKVLISNSGVASADVTGVGTARDAPSAAGYSFTA